jgi:hypothetical protein
MDVKVYCPRCKVNGMTLAPGSGLMKCVDPECGYEGREAIMSVDMETYLKIGAGQFSMADMSFETVPTDDDTVVRYGGTDSPTRQDTP